MLCINQFEEHNHVPWISEQALINSIVAKHHQLVHMDRLSVGGVRAARDGAEGMSDTETS